MPTFQFIYRVEGEQTHVRLFIHEEGKPDVPSGTLTMTKRQWWDLAGVLGAGAPAFTNGPRVDFVRIELPVVVPEVANG